MTSTAVTIRAANTSDQAAIRRLAALDSTRPPQGEILLAEEDGELRAALSATDGRAVADPFHRTGALVAMLRARTERDGEVVLRAAPRARRLRAALR